MHPLKNSAIEGHAAKLRRMTAHYGAADPKANILGPTNRGKQEGPEEAEEFGADSYQPTARPDRKSRRTAAANPVATYAKGGAVKRARGGKVKHRDAGGGLGSDIEAANVQQQLANPSKRAAGGRMKHKGKGATHVNVIVAPGGGAPGAPGAMPMMPPRPPMMPPAMPPHPPMAGPGMPPGVPGGGMPPGAMAPHPGLPPGAGMGPGTMPPGMPPGVPPAALAAMMQPRANGGAVGRKRGGKVQKRQSGGSLDDGTGHSLTIPSGHSVEEYLPQTGPTTSQQFNDALRRASPGSSAPMASSQDQWDAVKDLLRHGGKKDGGKVHADAKQDKALIERTLRDEGLIHSEAPSKRARGGNVETMKRLPQQKHHMTAGAVTGIGRLEKIGEEPKSAGPPQKV